MSEGPSPAAAPKRMSWLLIVSLALNLLVLGAIAGAVISHHRRGPPWPLTEGKLFDQINFGKTIGGQDGLRAFSQSLPPDRRAVLRPILDEARQTVKPLRDKAQVLREAAHSAFTAEPFDAAAAEKAAHDLFEGEAGTRKTIVTYFAKALSALTPEERAKFFAWRKAHAPPPPPPVEPPPPGPPK